MAHERDPKIQRRFTLEDIAQACGQQPEELREILKAKMLEKAETEAGSSETGPSKDEEMDDSFADGLHLVDGVGEVEKVSKDAFESRVQVLEAKVNHMGIIMNEVAAEMFKNMIRMEPGKGTKIKQFHVNMVPKISKAVLEKKEYVLVRVSSFHVDVVVADMSDPKGVTDKIKTILKNLGLYKKVFVTPPYDPKTNILKQPARAIYGVIMRMLDTAGEDDEIPYEAKPVTKWPFDEDPAPRFSMESKAGTVFLQGDYDKGDMVCSIRLRDEISCHKVTLKGEELARQIACAWRHPYRLKVQVVKKVVKLERAPDIKTARANARAKR